ncbi:hypothetical protein [Aurantiacibacter flavus]|uniref:Uncharacterized protein n=1 Tax=Aurantiacibacter flavus TaxID=3145232 RepID=A0ABV0CSH5_9SPHN
MDAAVGFDFVAIHTPDRTQVAKVLSSRLVEAGIGLVPISSDLMHMYVATPEPGNPWYDKDELAQAMREKLVKTSPQIREPAALTDAKLAEIQAGFDRLATEG